MKLERRLTGFRSMRWRFPSGEALPAMFDPLGLRELLLAGALKISGRVAHQVVVVRLKGIFG